MSQWFQRFVASSIHGKVSDATIQGYLRSASQIAEVWQQIDDNVDTLIAQGIAPWDAYSKLGFALAFVRACRTNVVCVEELLKADAAANTTNAGYLPKVTYDQALALCEHIEPYLEEAIKASTNPNYIPIGFTFPLVLGPHIKYPNQRFPLPHLQGVIGAAQQMRDWAAGLLAKYELALGAAKTPVPQAVSTHLDEMKSELKLGDFHLGMGVDMVGQITRGQVTDELNYKAEGFLWEAMESFFKVSQLVANPKVPSQPTYRNPRTANYVQNQIRHISPRPIPAILAQPVPDISSLMNQVTATPAPTQATPVESTPDVSDMLSQVTSAPAPTQATPAESTPDVSNMFDQDTSAPASIQSTPDVSDLLNQVTSAPAPTQATPSPKSPHAENHKSYLNKPASEDNLLDDVCGVQKEDN